MKITRLEGKIVKIMNWAEEQAFERMMREPAGGGKRWEEWMKQLHRLATRRSPEKGPGGEGCACASSPRRITRPGGAGDTACCRRKAVQTLHRLRQCRSLRLLCPSSTPPSSLFPLLLWGDLVVPSQTSQGPSVGVSSTDATGHSQPVAAHGCRLCITVQAADSE